MIPKNKDGTPWELATSNLQLQCIKADVCNNELIADKDQASAIEKRWTEFCSKSRDMPKTPPTPAQVIPKHLRDNRPEEETGKVEDIGIARASRDGNVDAVTDGGVASALSKTNPVPGAESGPAETVG